MKEDGFFHLWFKRQLMLLVIVFIMMPDVFAEDNQISAKWLEPERSRLIKIPENMPFFPHRATTTNNKILNQNEFEDARVCGSCHTEIYRQWRASLMSRSWDDPIYRALLKRASEATEGKIDNFCTGCHTPVGLTTGNISPTLNRASIMETEISHPMPGVDCESCHNISARTGLDNGAYVLSPMLNGMPTKFGPRQNAVSPYHDTVYSDLITRSDFCATCHNVTHPFTGVAVERTYDEWLESPYNHNGERCQSCHMPTFLGKAAVMGPDRSDVASHWFAGANVSVLEYFGEKENAQRARELLARAATMEFKRLPDAFLRGQIYSVQVKVNNQGAGHKLPTGFPEGREVWIDFKVTAADGREIYRLGAVKNGATELGTRNFKVHLGDKNGDEVDMDVWNVTQILSDNRILPKGYSLQEFSFLLPADTIGPVNISAELNYWPFSQKFVDFLLGENALKVEITRMTQVQQSVPVLLTEEVDAQLAQSAGSLNGSSSN